MSNKKILSALMAVVGFAFLNAAKTKSEEEPLIPEKEIGKNPAKKGCKKCGKNH